MKECSFWETQTDLFSADKEKRRAISAHAQSCASCRKALEQWCAVENVVRELEREKFPSEAPDPVATNLLIQRARKHASLSPLFGMRRRTAAILIGCSVAVAATIALLLFLPLTQPSSGNVSNPIIASIIVDDTVRPLTVEETSPVLTAPFSGRISAQIGRDLIGVKSGGSIRVDKAAAGDTRISLLNGTVCVAAAHRPALENLSIVSGKTIVKVVGTRFSVTRVSDDTVETSVVDGRVRVEKNGREWKVDKGFQLRVGPNDDGVLQSLRDENRQEIETLLSEKADAPPSPKSGPEDLSDTEEGASAADNHMGGSFDETEFQEEGAAIRGISKHNARSSTASHDIDIWRDLMLSGHMDEAEAALRSHVKQEPKDAAAWSLLADCYRKSAHWADALHALSNVESFGNASEAQRARFRAGVIFQDELLDHEKASKKFSSYIQTPQGSMKAEAMVRLAVSQIALGRNDEAKRLLEAAVKDHRGTTAAEKARKMLLEL